MHIRQPALDAVVVVAELFVIEAKEVERGSVQVVAVGGIFSGFETEIIGGAVSCATCDATASHPGGEGSGVVIATFALCGGLATKLGGADHERAFEQAA